jgi:predicted Zn-dependent protease
MSARTAPDRHIVLMPIVANDGVDEALFSALSAPVRDAFQAHVSTADAMTLPGHAYDAARQQYHSAVLLEALHQHPGVMQSAVSLDVLILGRYAARGTSVA